MLFHVQHLCRFVEENPLLLGTSSAWLVRRDLSEHGLVVLWNFLQFVCCVVAVLLPISVTLILRHYNQRFLIHCRLGMVGIRLVRLVVVNLDGPVGLTRHLSLLGQFVRRALFIQVVVSQLLLKATIHGLCLA